MAFADPQKVKIGATEHTLPRVDTGGGRSEYSKDDGTVSLEISTNKNSKRLRHMYRVNQSKIAPDSFEPSRNAEVSSSAYLVVDRPIAGMTNTEALDLAKGLLEALTEGAYADVKQLLARES